MPRRRAEQRGGDGTGDGTGGGDGERIRTIRDVATRAEVPVATVSRVLAGNYPTVPATRGKVPRAVKQLDYTVNVHARAPAGVRRKTIASLTREVVTPFYAPVIQGAEEQAAQDGRLRPRMTAAPRAPSWPRERALRVPQDIPIVGYDDVPTAAHMRPPLTTVHIPAGRIALPPMRRSPPRFSAPISSCASPCVSPCVSP